ncbi:unnamed protein product [Angiostrongylus costaricensis]|uniref:Phlebovirus_G2 domain-containing protein n=1 Tax=Angiostrongylus costaricensis TaxID=334426 RepID=A0A0R3PPM0_ANGCS|nr:unnamed protein product [Angiostrongylus costaricensis]
MEKALTDQQVWETFNKTIEKRLEGYYVRLPWKDIQLSLPDNRAIALNRLISVWKSHYLTSLREKHQSNSTHRSSKYTPKEDNLVLINDPAQPRYSWKMGRITELVKNSQGIAREAVIHLPSHRLIRRPLNLLTPLELDEPTLQHIQRDQGQFCDVQLSEVLKINPFTREACFKLLNDETSLHEIRIKWKSLTLTCEPETDLFTRDTAHHVIDSKRCPHTGSCKGEKCAGINATSLIPKLAIGNKYPGITACVESCRGPGCDCFYWSSGCLFYRIYLFPTSSTIYEIFHCNRWKEAAKVEITYFNQSHVTQIRPNIPFKHQFFTLTLSSITVPPIPKLNTLFISDGKRTAIWNSHITPPLRCANQAAAENLNCSMESDCTCYPAETQANCRCEDVKIASWFNNVQNRLPIILPSISFQQNQEGEITAKVLSMRTAEVILNIQNKLETNIVVDKDIRTVDDTVIQGCYRCRKGSKAQVRCKSSRPIQAEIARPSATFSIPYCKSLNIWHIPNFYSICSTTLLYYSHHIFTIKQSLTSTQPAQLFCSAIHYRTFSIQCCNIILINNSRCQPKWTRLLKLHEHHRKTPSHKHKSKHFSTQLHKREPTTPSQLPTLQLKRDVSAPQDKPASRYKHCSTKCQAYHQGRLKRLDSFPNTDSLCATEAAEGI